LTRLASAFVFTDAQIRHSVAHPPNPVILSGTGRRFFFRVRFLRTRRPVQRRISLHPRPRSGFRPVLWPSSPILRHHANQRFFSSSPAASFEYYLVIGGQGIFYMLQWSVITHRRAESLPVTHLHGLAPSTRAKRDPLFSVRCALFSIPYSAYVYSFLAPAHSLPTTPGGGGPTTFKNFTSSVTPIESNCFTIVPSNPFRILLFRKQGAGSRAARRLKTTKAILS